MTNLILRFLGWCLAILPKYAGLLLYLSWACWPGLMFLFGIIFESRFLTLGRRQSRAFIPGDFALAPTMMAFLRMYEQTGVLKLARETLWWPGVMLGMLVVAIFLRHGDCLNYQKCFRNEAEDEPGKKRWRQITWSPVKNEPGEKQWRRLIWSPTKALHDAVGYYLIPALLVGLGVPQLSAALKIPGVFAATWTYWISAAICLAFYIACVRWDGKRPEPDVMTMLDRHTPDWVPIWTREGWEEIRRAFSKLFGY